MKKFKFLFVFETILLLFILIVVFIWNCLTNQYNKSKKNSLFKEIAPNKKYSIQATVFNDIFLLGWDYTYLIKICVSDKENNLMYSTWLRYNFNDNMPTDKNYDIYWYDDYVKLVFSASEKSPLIKRIYFEDMERNK